MLRQEKYIGSALLQKTYTENFKEICNDGSVPQYWVDNNHEAMIDKDIFYKVQEKLNIQAEKSRRHPKYSNGKSPFSMKIKCSECGHGYTRRKNNRNTPYEKFIWCCSTYVLQGRDYCKGYNIREKDLHRIFLSAYNEAIEYEDKSADLSIIKSCLTDLIEQEQEINALYVKRYINKESYKQENQQIAEQIRKLEERYENELRNRTNLLPKKKAEEYSDDLVYWLDSAEIKEYNIIFKFKNGAEIGRIFNNDRKRK